MGPAAESRGGWGLLLFPAGSDPRDCLLTFFYRRQLLWHHLDISKSKDPSLPSLVDLRRKLQPVSFNTHCLMIQELRIIVASATLDAEQFRDFFETNRCVRLSPAPFSAPWFPSLPPSAYRTRSYSESSLFHFVRDLPWQCATILALRALGHANAVDFPRVLNHASPATG